MELQLMITADPVQQLKETNLRLANLSREMRLQAEAIVKKLRSFRSPFRTLSPQILQYVELYEQGLIPAEYFIFRVSQILNEIES
jgi:hypothetical protein